MAKFRKKPVVIEATQWFENGDHPQDNSCPRSPEDPTLCEGKIVRRFKRPGVAGSSLCGHCQNSMHVHGWIETLEGGHIVCPGDWVITGVKGEMYPCKLDIFEATYEAVE